MYSNFYSTLSDWQIKIFFLPSGWLRLCQEDRVWEENVDLLWDAGVCSTRDHSEQGPRHLSWLLVSRNPHVWALNWQVHTSLGMSVKLIYQVLPVMACGVLYATNPQQMKNYLEALRVFFKVTNSNVGMTFECHLMKFFRTNAFVTQD